MDRKKRKRKPAQAPPVVLRLPSDAKKWLEKQAFRNASSQNSEVVRCVRAAMDSESRETRTSAAG